MPGFRVPIAGRARLLFCADVERAKRVAWKRVVGLMVAAISGGVCGVGYEDDRK